MIYRSAFMERRKAEAAEISRLAFEKLIGVARKHTTDDVRARTEEIIAAGSFSDLLDWCFWLQTRRAS